MVKVEVETAALDSLDDAFFRQFTVVCCSDVPLAAQLRLDALCRTNPGRPIAFFATESFGLAASLFCDLGRHEYLKPAPARKGDDEAGEAAPPAPEKVLLQFPSLADVVAAPWKPLNAHKRKPVGLQIVAPLRLHVSNHMRIFFEKDPVRKFDES